MGQDTSKAFLYTIIFISVWTVFMFIYMNVYTNAQKEPTIEYNVPTPINNEVYNYMKKNSNEDINKKLLSIQELDINTNTLSTLNTLYKTDFFTKSVEIFGEKQVIGEIKMYINDLVINDKLLKE